MNNIAMNIHVHVFVWLCFEASLDLLGHKVTPYLTLEALPNSVSKSCTMQHPNQQSLRVSLSPHPRQYLLSFHFALICISLMMVMLSVLNTYLILCNWACFLSF